MIELPHMELKDFNFNTIIKLLGIWDKPIIPSPNINEYVVHGIKFSLAKEYEADLNFTFKWNGKVNTFTQDMCKYILERHYWNKISGSQLLSIHRLLADRMMDFAFNTDVQTAVRSLCTICNLVSSNGKYWDIIQIKDEMDYELITTLRSIFQIKGNGAINVIIAMLFSSQVKAIMDRGLIGPYTADIYEACENMFFKQTWYASIVLAIR